MGSESRFSNTAGSSSLTRVSVGARALLPESEGRRPDERVQPGKKSFVVFRCFPGCWVSGADFFAKKLEKSLERDKKLAYLCTRFRAGNGPWARGGKDEGRARFFDTDETRKDKQRRASGMFFLRDARKPWRGQ